MADDRPGDGWSWFDPSRQALPANRVKEAAIRALGTPDGRLILAHLRQRFLDRRLEPTASDAELRHLEGQRSAIAHLLSLLVPDTDRAASGSSSPHAGGF